MRTQPRRSARANNSGRHTRHSSRVAQRNLAWRRNATRPRICSPDGCSALPSASAPETHTGFEQPIPHRRALLRIHDTTGPAPECLSCTSTAAVGTHDHSGRHTRHCSRFNRCNRASPSARVPRPCHDPDESHAASLPFRRPDRLATFCASQAAHAPNSHGLRAPQCAPPRASKNAQHDHTGV